jgi:hypothetical protein
MECLDVTIEQRFTNRPLRMRTLEFAGLREPVHVSIHPAQLAARRMDQNPAATPAYAARCNSGIAGRCTSAASVMRLAANNTAVRRYLWPPINRTVEAKSHAGDTGAVRTCENL